MSFYFISSWFRILLLLGIPIFFKLLSSNQSRTLYMDQHLFDVTQMLFSNYHTHKFRNVSFRICNFTLLNLIWISDSATVRDSDIYWDRSRVIKVEFCTWTNIYLRLLKCSFRIIININFGINRFEIWGFTSSKLIWVTIDQ